jgi:hypothetical protein
VMFTPKDAVAKAVKRDKNFEHDYTLVASGTTTNFTSVKLYHKNGLPPLPTRPISAYLLGEKQTCAASNYTTS